MPEPFLFECEEASLHGLAAGVLDAFRPVAEAYFARTGQRLLVTSARRSLRKTATLMAGFSKEQLEGMYCRNGYPSYIRELVNARLKNGGALSAEEAYTILCNRKEGYISSHLYGAALDIAADGLSQPELAMALLKEAGFRVLNEVDLGVACIHATFLKTPTQIIKE